MWLLQRYFHRCNTAASIHGCKNERQFRRCKNASSIYAAETRVSIIQARPPLVLAATNVNFAARLTKLATAILQLWQGQPAIALTTQNPRDRMTVTGEGPIYRTVWTQLQ